MIFHASIAAKSPERVASAVAELWRGEAMEFLPAKNGSWMALAPDERNSALEVYPHGNLLSHEDGTSMVKDPDPTGVGLSATHLAIATDFSQDQVIALAEREGWLARPAFRAAGFNVVEVWVENRVMLEVMTPEMQAEYLETTTIPQWQMTNERFRAGTVVPSGTR